MDEYLVLRAASIAMAILDTLSEDPKIPMSWGMENPRPANIDGQYGLTIQVNGYKHQGFVTILYNHGNDTFKVWLIGVDGETKNVTEGVSLQNLVSTIDEQIEKTENYEQRISEDYPELKESAKREDPLTVIIV